MRPPPLRPLANGDCSRLPPAGVRMRSAGFWSPTARRCMGTATGCSARRTTPVAGERVCDVGQRLADRQELATPGRSRKGRRARCPSGLLEQRRAPRRVSERFVEELEAGPRSSRVGPTTARSARGTRTMSAMVATAPLRVALLGVGEVALQRLEQDLVAHVEQVGAVRGDAIGDPRHPSLRARTGARSRTSRAGRDRTRAWPPPSGGTRRGSARTARSGPAPRDRERPRPARGSCPPPAVRTPGR